MESTPMIVNFMYQFDWVKGYPDSWYNAISGFIRMLPGVISILIGELSKADGPSQCGRAYLSFEGLNRQKAGGRLNFFSA